MILNCDLVIASQDAKFALPEVKRGVVAAQGGKYFIFFRSYYFYLTDNTIRYSPAFADSRTPGKFSWM